MRIIGAKIILRLFCEQDIADVIRWTVETEWLDWVAPWEFWSS